MSWTLSSPSLPIILFFFLSMFFFLFFSLLLNSMFPMAEKGAGLSVSRSRKGVLFRVESSEKWVGL